MNIKGTVFVPLKGKKYSEVTKLDINDYLKFKVYNYKWTYNNGYAVRNEKVIGRKYTKKYLHQHVTEFKHDMIDHINQNKLDNTSVNLRPTNYSLNRVNSKNNKGRKYKGTKKSYNRWVAVIRFKGKNIHIGTYGTEIDAAIGYNIKAIELFGKHAALNKV